MKNDRRYSTAMCAKCCFAALLLVIGGCGNERDQTKLRVLPCTLDFGENYSGAIIQGSFQVINAGTVKQIDCRSFLRKPSQKLEPIEDWLELQGEWQSTPQNGLARTFTVKTSTPGNYLSFLTIHCSKGTARIRASIEIKDGKAPNGDLVFCSSPFWCCMDAAPLRDLTRIIKQLGCRVHFVDDLDCLKEVAPRGILLQGNGLLAINCDVNGEQKQLLYNHVESGSDLIVFAGDGFPQTKLSANEVLKKYGLQFLESGAERLAPSEENSRIGKEWREKYPPSTTQGDLIGADPITRGIRMLRWGRPCPIVCNADDILQLVGVPARTNEYFAAGIRAGGQVIAIGDSGWFNFTSVGWPYDNDRFFANLLLGGDVQ